MGSGSFQGQNGIFRRFWGNFGIFLSGWRVLAQNTGALAKFGDFWSVWSGLGPNRK
jgi:hypothetical protein